MKRIVAVLVTLACACAGPEREVWRGNEVAALQPGMSAADVVHVMGKPQQNFVGRDGKRYLVYEPERPDASPPDLPRVQEVFREASSEHRAVLVIGPGGLELSRCP